MSANFALVMLIGLPLTVVLVRTMSARQYGLLTLGTTIATIAATVSAFGLNAAVAQAAASRAGTHGGSAVTIATRAGLVVARRVALAAVALAAVSLVLVLAIPSTRATAAVVAVMFPTIALAPFFAVYTGVLQSAFAARRLVMISVATLVLAGVLTLVFVFAHQRSATWIAFARSLAWVAGVLALYLIARPLARGSTATLARGSLPSIAPFAVAMALTASLWVLISQLDVFFVGVLKGPLQAGLYSPASKVADVALTFSGALASFLLPALAVTSTREPASVASLYHWSSRWNLVLLAPALGLMVVCPSALLVTLFGARYAIVAGPMRILGAAATLHILFGFNGLTLDAFGLPRAVTLRSLSGVVVSLVCCPLLVALLGLSGAAIATAAAILVVNVLSSLLLLRRFSIWPWSAHNALTVAIFFLSMAAAWAITSLTSPSHIWRCVIVAAISGIATCAAALACGDWRDVPRLVGRWRPRGRQPVPLG
jgi:O-antigen/teichoic acid export membrane protein